MKDYIRSETVAFIYIKCTLKNTLITVTNSKKEPIFQRSSRSYDLKIKRKNNPYILSKITFEIIDMLKKLRYVKLGIYINGIGSGRYNILKHLTKKFKILIIEDRTRIPFNGCRAKKRKRK